MFYFNFLTLIIWFDLFLEARAEILTKISLVFWEIWRHQKEILKLTDLSAELAQKKDVMLLKKGFIGRS